MRTAVVFNFLLEANLMASAAILLMMVFRKFLRRPLGNRLIYCLWLLIAIRLLCPLALSNPLINEFRPSFLDDQAIRPIAGQIKVRLEDAVNGLRRLWRTDRSSLLYQTAHGISEGMMYYGTLSKSLYQVYLYGAGAVLLFFGAVNIRFRRKMKASRIELISGKLKEQYLAVCEKRRIKPIPVWFADPLPSACLVGVVRPYIALPLTAAPQEAIHVLTHELCHYQGKDHWLGVLRLLCCVVHWFNPLVWVAAFMSRTDGELACDSRVVKDLPPEERMSYTNTLVLAASKRYAPGVGVLATGMTMTGRKLQSRVRSILHFEHAVKWLAVTAALLACMLLTASFFTAEGGVNATRFLSGIDEYYSIVARSDNTFAHVPGGSVSLEDALDIAMQEIGRKYSEDISDRSNYSVMVNYMEYYWVLQIHNRTTGRTYDINVDATDGSILLSEWGNG